MREQKKHKWYITVIVVVVVIAVWWLATNVGNVSDVILPKPQNVLKAMVDLIVNGYGTNKDTLLVHMAASMKRLLLAYGLSIVAGVPLGLLCGYFPKVSSIFTPIVEFYRPIPPLAYYTILVLWLGINEESPFYSLRALLRSLYPVFPESSGSVRII